MEKEQIDRPLTWLFELDETDKVAEELVSASSLRAGDLCPQCKTERLDYDGLLNLSCPKCGPVVGGCFT